jgi:hypothetical protein
MEDTNVAVKTIVKFRSPFISFHIFFSWEKKSPHSTCESSL